MHVDTVDTEKEEISLVLINALVQLYADFIDDRIIAVFFNLSLDLLGFIRRT